ncbi:MAG TPA: phosphomannose isomerase type II C-terminal cupin domain [Nitrososphaeraceae archaeon]|nr:phosphomannose isomerase type II C-terminal cupin domain [Nitrososphaeraceae archaeon]
MKIYSEDRPWGRFEKFHENKISTVKLIYITPNHRLSLQYHAHRNEFWRIISGTAEVEIDGKTFNVREGDNITINSNSRHRIKGLANGCTVLEISYGHFDEDDIVRIEDDFNRIDPTPMRE